MRDRSAVLVLSVLLAISIGIIAFLLVRNSPEAPSSNRDVPGSSPSLADRTAPSAEAGTLQVTATADGPEASSGVREARGPHTVPTGRIEPSARARQLFETATTDVARDAARAEILKREVTEAFQAVARDEKASSEDRQIAFEMLSTAHVHSGILFPLAVQFSREEDPAFANMATETLSAMVLRGEELPDEAQATRILAASAQPHNNDSMRRAASRGLAKLKGESAVTALVGLLADEDHLVRRFAFEGLKDLAGDTFGYDYRATRDGQEQALARWQAWAREYDSGGAR